MATKSLNSDNKGKELTERQRRLIPFMATGEDSKEITGAVRISPRTGKPMQKHLGKTTADLQRRARIIAKEIIAGSSETAALVAAGYSHNYASHQKDEILSNPTIIKTFNKILDAAGVTDARLADKINSLIDAKETKYYAHQGTVTDSREVEALEVQANMVQFAARLKGHLAEKREDASTTNVNVMSLSRAELMEIVARGRAGKKGKVIDVTPSESGKGAVNTTASQDEIDASIRKDKAI